jgi:hypothetical protein
MASVKDTRSSQPWTSLDLTEPRSLSLDGTNFATLDRFQPMSRRCKNVASPVNSITSGLGPDFIDHCGRSILYGWVEGIENMVIETVLFIAFAVIVGAATVKPTSGTTTFCTART